ncbi:MAG: BON domain-containing protein [Burkholderiaceae bacterium]|jgi:osmotically-inducible protein OsmY|nr:BON domain-containing protein [Burkholderiaceae bacterium]
MNKSLRIVSWIAAAALTAAAAGQLAGCAVAVISGAAGAGALVLTSGRRSGETATADSRIESQGSDSIEQALAGHDRHVNVTSYYRKALLTGEVISDADRARAQAAAQSIQGVQAVFNDLAVMPPSSMLSRSQDAYITSKVKTRFMHTNGVPAASIKVLTERGTVYLMGRLTRQETQSATSAAQQVDGVQRVARIIDFVPDSAITGGSTSTITGGGYAAPEAADAPVNGGVNDVAPPPAPAAAPAPAGVETHPIR